MITENSRADALTDNERELLEHACYHLQMQHSQAACNALRKLLILAASPSSQPAAAPIDDQILQLAQAEGFAIKDTRSGQWVLAGSEPVAGFLRIVRAVASGASIAHPASSPADERAAWDNARDSLAVAMAGFATRSGSRDFNAALTVLDAITEPGLPLSWLRTARAASANETGAEGARIADDMRAEQTYLGSCREACDNSGRIRWDRLQRVIDFFESRSPAMAAEAVAIPAGYAQKPFGWAQPKGGNYFTRNESSAKRIGGLVPVYTAPQPVTIPVGWMLVPKHRGADALAHEVWSAAQRAPGEGIEDAVQRIAAILSRSPATAAEAAAIPVGHPRDMLMRLQMILESGRALNGISNDRATIYAGALREVLDAPQPAQAGARVGLTDALIRKIATQYCEYDADGQSYNILRYECEEDFFNCIRALLQGANHAE